MIGVITMFAGASVPADFLACDGSTHNVVDYPELAAILGNNGTFFTVPDFSTYIPVGGTSPGTITQDSTKLSQNFSISHSGNTDNDGWSSSLNNLSFSSSGSHSHSVSYSGSPFLGTSSGTSWFHRGGSGCSHNMGGPVAAHAGLDQIRHEHTINSQSQGQGGAHEHYSNVSGSWNHGHSMNATVSTFALPGSEVPTMPKRRVVHYIIRAL